MRTFLYLFAAVLLFGTVALGKEAAPKTADWPQFRGPTGNCQSPETGLLKKWPEGGPELLRTITGFGNGWGGIAVAGGRLYIGGSLEKYKGRLALSCFDVATGKKLWDVDGGQEGHSREWGGQRGTPAVDGKMVYYLSDGGTLGAYDTISGDTVWRLTFQERFNAREHGFAFCESVLVDGDLVLSTPGASNACFAALNKKTGETVWTSKGVSDITSCSSGVIADFGGVRQFVNMTKDGFVSIRVKDGTLVWRSDKCGAEFGAPGPIFSDPYVFGSSGYCQLGRAVELKKNAGNVTAETAWDTTEYYSLYQTFVIVDGYLYGFSSSRGKGYNYKCIDSINGRVCVEMKTGKRTYTMPCAKKGADTAGVKGGSVIYVDGMLYYWSPEGTVDLVELNPKEYKVVSSFKVPARGDKFYTHPAVADGKLFLRTGGGVLVYDIREKSAGANR